MGCRKNPDSGTHKKNRLSGSELAVFTGGWVLFLRRLFDVFHDLAGFDAGSANGKLFGGAVNLGPDGLEVRIPASFGPVLSV